MVSFLPPELKLGVHRTGPIPSLRIPLKPGGYINLMDDDDRSRIRGNYKGNCDRLVAIKGIYDPDNLFHLNQDIRPKVS